MLDKRTILDISRAMAEMGEQVMQTTSNRGRTGAQSTRGDDDSVDQIWI